MRLREILPYAFYVASALVLLWDVFLAGQIAQLRRAPRVFRGVTALAALPGLAAWLLERAFAVRLALDERLLIVRGRGRRMEIPHDAVAGAVPWRVPLPRSGVTLRLRSGGRLAVALDDPGTLLARLGGDRDFRDPVVRWDPSRVERAGHSTVCAVVVLDCPYPARSLGEPGSTVAAGSLLFEVDC